MAKKVEMLTNTRLLAEKGDSFAQFMLGRALLKEDRPQALKWLRAAAEQGNEEAAALFGKAPEHPQRAAHQPHRPIRVVTGIPAADQRRQPVRAAGGHLLTAEGPAPEDLREALVLINKLESTH